ncbi:MAG: glycosyltransferase [Luteibaculaceae bacterium]
MLLTATVFVCIYLVLLLFFLFSVEPFSTFTSRKNLNTDVTVLCAFKDEYTNRNKLKALAQMCNDNGTALILINDNSEDKPHVFWEGFFADFAKTRVIENKGVGKKAALKSALEYIDTHYCVITDADCTYTKTWLPTIKENIRESIGLLILPVNQKGGAWLAEFSRFEFVAMQWMGIKMAARGNPLFASAANLCVSTKLLKEVPYKKSEGLSGDDMFLLNYTKKYYGNDFVSAVVSKDAVVTTDAPQTFSALIEQRIRWGKKVLKYQSLVDVIPGLLYFFIQVSWLIIFAFALFQPLSTGFFVVSKLLIEFWFFKKTTEIFEGDFSFFAFTTSSLIYPFYAVFMVILALIVNPKWKGRKVFS